MKCQHQKCEDDAAYRAFWPGRASILYCQYHREVAENIAKSAGFNLVLNDLDAEKLARLDPTNLGDV